MLNRRNTPRIVLPIDLLLLLHLILCCIFVKSEQSLLEQVLHFFFVELPVIGLDSYQVKSVDDQHGLNFLVEGA